MHFVLDFKSKGKIAGRNLEYGPSAWLVRGMYQQVLKKNFLKYLNFSRKKNYFSECSWRFCPAFGKAILSRIQVHSLD